MTRQHSVVREEQQPVERTPSVECVVLSSCEQATLPSPFTQAAVGHSSNGGISCKNSASDRGHGADMSKSSTSALA
jgi:hypothetical protein